jgi:hypothetical protein
MTEMASVRCSIKLLVLASSVLWVYGANQCYDLTGNCLASPSFVLALPSSDNSIDR